MTLFLYCSDLHINHANIITYSQRPFDSVDEMNQNLLASLRYAMSDYPESTVICCGDWSMNFRKVTREYGVKDAAVVLGDKVTPLYRLWPLEDRKRIIFVTGNHDSVRKQAQDYLEHFAHVIGTEKTWKDNVYMVTDVLDAYTAGCLGIEREADGEGRVPVRVLCSHAPQTDLQGCDINVHGHIHNTLVLGNGLNGDHHPEYNWTWESPRHFNASVECTGYRPISLSNLIVRKELRMA